MSVAPARPRCRARRRAGSRGRPDTRACACGDRSTSASPPRPGGSPGEWAAALASSARSLDPDELLEHTLAEVAASARCRRGAGRARRGRPATHRRVRHLARGGGAASRCSRRRARTSARSRSSTATDWTTQPAARRGPRAGMVVPLAARATRRSARSPRSAARRSARFFDERVDALEGIARRAGPALVTARRFAEARQLADLDALTGLYNRRSFHETLAARGRPRPPLRAAARSRS